MKKTLLCLMIGIIAFLIGTLTHSLFHQEKIAVNTSQLEELKVYSPQPLPSKSVEKEEEDEYLPSPDGAYFPVNEKGLEKDFALTLGFYENKPSAEVIVGEKFYVTNILIFNHKKVSFKTKKVRGLEYTFNGRFLKDPFKEWFEDGETLLEGTLQKTKNSKVLYKLNKKFIFDSEVCAWKDIEFEQAN
jgi:hypothetical protein